MRQVSAQEDWKSPLIPNGAGGGRMKTAWTPVLVFGAFLLLVGAFVLNKEAFDPFEFAISSEIAVGDVYTDYRLRGKPVTKVPANADAFKCTPGKINNIGPCRCGDSKVVCTNFYPVCVHKGSNVPSSSAIATEDMCLRPCMRGWNEAKCGWEYELRPAFWKYAYVRFENALTCHENRFCAKNGEYLHYENPMIGFDDRTKRWVMNLIDKEYTDPQSKAYHELYTMPCNRWTAEYGDEGAYKTIDNKANKEQFWKCQETTSPPESKANLLPEDSFAVMIWGDNPINMGGHSGMLANVPGLGMYFVDWKRSPEAGAPAQKGKHMLKGPDVIFVIKNAGIDVAEWKEFNVWASADEDEEDNGEKNSNCARNVKKGLRTSAFGKANIARYSQYQWAKGMVNAVGIKQGSFYTPWYVARQLTWCVKNPSSCKGGATVTLYKRPDMSKDYFHDRYDYYSSIFDAALSRIAFGHSERGNADTSNERYKMHRFQTLQQGEDRKTSCDGAGAVSDANIEGATFVGSPTFAYKFSEITDRIDKANRCMAACDGSTACKFLQFSCSSSDCFCELYSACDELTRNDIPSAASHRVWEKNQEKSAQF